MRPQTSPDLHGNAPDKCEVALVLVDVINDLEFNTGPKLLKPALRAGEALAELKARAQRAGVPCIYVNDNFGRWRSDFRSQVRHCLKDGTRGAPLVSLLAPTDDDYFVLKPKHSAFYQTCLSMLLDHLGTKTLVIGGFTTESCVTITATDAYLRSYGLVIPHDGTASAEPRAHRGALQQMERTLHAQTPSCEQIKFVRSAKGARLRLPRA